MMDEESVPLQADRYQGRWPQLRIAKSVAELAYEEYAKQGHGSQSFERLHDRGGFSEGEVLCLLHDALLRERGLVGKMKLRYTGDWPIEEVMS